MSILLWAARVSRKHAEIRKKFSHLPSGHGIQQCFTKMKPCNLKAMIRGYGVRFMEREAAPNEGHSISLIAKLMLGGGALVIAKGLNGYLIVECKDSKVPPSIEIHDRVEGAETVLKSKDPPFDWLFFWELLKPQLHFFLSALASALLVALANIQVPVVLGDIVNVLAKFSQEGISEGRTYWEEIYQPAKTLVLHYIVQGVATFAYITFLTAMGEGIADDLRQRLFNNLLKQDISFYDEHKTGELVNRLSGDVQDFKSSFKMCMSQGLRNITQIIGCTTSLYLVSPQLTGLIAIIVPAVIGIGTLLGSLLRSLSRKAQHQLAKATGVADECLSNMRTVRAFAMEDEEEKLFAREVEKSRKINERLGFGIGIFQAGSNMFLNGLVLATLYFGGSMVAGDQVKAGDLMTFLVAAQTIQRSLSQLSVLFGYYVRGISAGARVFEFVKFEATIPVKGGQIIPYHTFMGNVEFNNVSFAYPTRPDQEVLKNFSLRIPAGGVVALVGASGGGKSTVAQLIERFYDVTNGSVTIDGVDVRSLDPSWLRGRVIGYINQEPVLFATSILENIRYGRPSATDTEVIEAAKMANAHEFIEAFPRGYKTKVGERGVTVSGGQKQRIAIARALLKDPRVLILDEATSALDAESEAVVQAALEQCIEGRTVLIIAHRLSTIQKADVIAVMSNGKLVELGTHKELQKLGGIYADLIRQQQRDDATDKPKSILGGLWALLGL